MSDSRSISGTVKVQQDSSVANVAYSMAKDLWFEQHKSWPSMSNHSFILLVHTCSLALHGHSGTSAESLKTRMAALNSDK